MKKNLWQNLHLLPPTKRNYKEKNEILKKEKKNAGDSLLKNKSKFFPDKDKNVELNTFEKLQY